MIKNNGATLKEDTKLLHSPRNTAARKLTYNLKQRECIRESLEPFCDLVQTSISREQGAVRRAYWSAHTVQREIRSLLNSPAFNKSPHSAYLQVYRKMTAARDKARCTMGNPMNPSNKLDRRLNDALSDLMTRNYLEIVASCVAEPRRHISSGLDLGGNFRGMHRMAEKQNWDAVRVALGSTGLYLTQHISLALSTLPHLDELWEGTPYVDILSRTNRMKEFKPSYDAFNRFLGKNLVTVAQALHAAELTRGDNLEKAAQLAQPIVPTHLFFGALRDKAFKLGLSIATHTPKGQHPWTVCDEDGRIKMASQVLQSPAFPNNEELQKDLSQLQRFSRETSITLANPLTGIFKGKRYNAAEILVNL